MTPGRRREPEILARRLTRSFPVRGRSGWRARRRFAVRELDLAVEAGEVVALVGENGSGKTTTLRLLAGLLAPDSGDARIAGCPATLPAARRRLGFAAEEDRFPGGLDVRGVLRLHASLAGLRGSEAKAAATRAAAALDLGPWLSRRPSRCSRGVRRRVSLAQAILGRPAILVLDEPFTGLDPVARGRAFVAVRRSADCGAAVLVSLHDERAVEAIAERVVAIAAGTVVAAGPVEELRRRPRAGGPEDGAGWLGDLLRSSGPNRGGGDPPASVARG